MLRLSIDARMGNALRRGTMMIYLALQALLVVAVASSQRPSSHLLSSTVHHELLANPEEVRIADYGWLSQGTLIVKCGDSLGGDWQLEQLDAGTRKLSPFPAAINSHKNGRLRPAPDGKRLLFETQSGDWIVTGLNGHVLSEHKAAPITRPSEACWLPDGSGWAQMGTALLYLFDASSAVATTNNVVSSKEYQLFGYRGLIGFLDSRHVLVSESRLIGSPAFENCNLIVYELGNPVTKLQTMPFKVPQSWVRAVSISPDCKRLCWLVLRPVDPEHADTSDCVASFYVTSIDGSGKSLVYEIGLPGVKADSLQLLSDHTEGPPYVPTKLKWSYDGSRICYLLDGKLWAVDVPDSAGRGQAREDHSPAPIR